MGDYLLRFETYGWRIAMTFSDVTWSPPLLQRLARVIRERLQRLHDLRVRLLRVPELEGRDVRELYLNP
jgi:hypothetical protein